MNSIFPGFIIILNDYFLFFKKKSKGKIKSDETSWFFLDIRVVMYFVWILLRILNNCKEKIGKICAKIFYKSDIWNV